MNATAPSGKFLRPDMIGLMATATLVLSACGGSGSGTGSASSPGAEMRAHRPAALAVCTRCHTLGPNEPNRVGPNLYRIMGQVAGSQESYAYSSAMRESDIVWTAKTLDHFLAAPTKMIPGTRMRVALHDEKRRQAVINYLVNQ